jgi:hypothetical protein
LLRHLSSDWKLHWHWPLGLRERGRIHLSLSAKQADINN